MWFRGRLAGIVAPSVRTLLYADLLHQGLLT